MKSIGDRMKRYEAVSQQVLCRRTPVIIRIDGKAFHTFTRGMERPFDDALMMAMKKTATGVMKEMDGAVFAYGQSDEISILLKDWNSLTTEAWFDYKLQKLASVSASLATGHFNRCSSLRKTAFFDARAFNLPMEEVCNYFIWRQQDATRNSVQMVAQSHFSHKSMQGQNVKELQHRLICEKGVNWNDLQTQYKRGWAIYGGEVDVEPPIFTQDRAFIERFLCADELGQ